METQADNTVESSSKDKKTCQPSDGDPDKSDAADDKSKTVYEKSNDADQHKEIVDHDKSNGDHEMVNGDNDESVCDLVKPVDYPGKSVRDLINKIKTDPQLSDSGKLDTLGLLVINFRKENDHIQNEIRMVNHQTTKHIEAKIAINALNEFLRRQIDIIKEEGELLLQEEKTKTSARDEGKEENNTEETDEEEDKVERIKIEHEMQITVLEHKVAKAKIEAAEVKADLAKERLEVTRQLAEERERGLELNETIPTLKQQVDQYQGEMLGLCTAGQENTKSFQSFKDEISGLNNKMISIEKQTEEWKENSEKNIQEAKDLVELSTTQDSEMQRMMKKLETMVSLNKALQVERSLLLEKVKKKE